MGSVSERRLVFREAVDAERVERVSERSSRGKASVERTDASSATRPESTPELVAPLERPPTYAGGAERGGVNGRCRTKHGFFQTMLKRQCLFHGFLS